MKSAEPKWTTSTETEITMQNRLETLLLKDSIPKELVERYDNKQEDKVIKNKISKTIN